MKTYIKSSKPLVEFFEKSFKRTPILKFDGLEKEDVPKNLESFLLKMFVSYKNKYDTIKAKSGQYVCDTERHRSLNDIYALCRYYIDNVTLSDVIKALDNLIEKNKICGLYTCCNIKRYVFEVSYNTYKIFRNQQIYEKYPDKKIYDLFNEVKNN